MRKGRLKVPIIMSCVMSPKSKKLMRALRITLRACITHQTGRLIRSCAPSNILSCMCQSPWFYSHPYSHLSSKNSIQDLFSSYHGASLLISSFIKISILDLISSYHGAPARSKEGSKSTHMKFSSYIIRFRRVIT